MRMRQEELMEILKQAGPKGKELATAIGKRGQVELHVHINGPILIGSDIALALAPKVLEKLPEPEPAQ